jgi:pyruvate kinase
MLAGVNVFRINFSHALHDEVKNTITNIREISSALNVHVSVLGDLQGPKIWLGLIKEDISVKKGDVLSITTNDIECGDNSLISINYSDFPKDVSMGEKVLVDDGKLIFKILKTNRKDLVEVKVLQGGALKSKKGVNLPNTNISLPALTKKDKEDALFAIENHVDWIALSFVRTKKDVKQLQKLLEKQPTNV